MNVLASSRLPKTYGPGRTAMAGRGGLSRAALLWAIGTACFTASYTMADGVGARRAGDASAFAMWMFVGDGLTMLAYAFATRGRRALVPVLAEWRTGLPAGC